MGIGPHPGKFPAKILAVSDGLVTLDAAAEDVEYLVPFMGKMVTVEITPDHNGGDPDSGDKAASAG